MIILQMEIPIPMKEIYHSIKILDNNIIKWNLEQIHKITRGDKEIEFKDPHKTKTKIIHSMKLIKEDYTQYFEQLKEQEKERFKELKKKKNDRIKSTT